MSDEFQAIQGDPLYFRHWLRQIQNTAFQDTLDEPTRQGHTVTRALVYIMWSALFRIAASQVNFVLETLALHKDQIRIGRPIPEQYASAVLLLQINLTKLFEGQVSDLNSLMSMTKTFESLSTFSSTGKAKCNTSREDLFKKHPLMWSVMEIQDRNDSSAGPTYHLQHIDHLITRSASSSKDRVPDIFATHVSNMIVDILMMMKCHRPRPDIYDDLDALNDRVKEGHYHPITFSQTGIRGSWSHIEKLWPTLKRFLNLPLPTSKVSLASLTRSRALRAGAEEFWDIVFGILNKADQYAAGKSGCDLTSKWNKQYTRTTKYREEVAEEERALKHAISELEEERIRRSQAANIATPYVVPQTSQRFGEKDKPAPLGPKQKIKTRNADAGTSSADQISEKLSTVNLDEPRLKLVVSAKSKDFFDRMFGVYAAESGDVDWKSLVAAMVDAGCSAVPNTGSEVTFKDKDVNKASIVLHRPHDSTINPIMLKSMGSRVRRRFDWDAQTFVRREKDCGKGGDANDA
ncbi:hypothetical protein LTR27_007652 [Elasticomyces elasticus]|nr:hypothetical protein LTR27_007652 [Elasticomyces elasticus]